MKIDGKEIAGDIIARLRSKTAPKKILAAVLVGEDPRSISFLRQKERAAKKLGVDFRIYRLSEDYKNDDLRREVGRIAKQKPVGGVIVQLPLPDGVSSRYVLNAVPVSKDVDVLSEKALAAFQNEKNTILPPAVGAVKEILERMSVELHDSTVAVLGKGTLVGSPVSTWLTGKCKKLYTLDSKSSMDILSQADIIISGVGRARALSPDVLKDGAGVIDFGYHYSRDGEVSGDLGVDSKNDLDKLAFYTPTPGGTGPIVVAKLLENFYTLCEK